jgi:hypothetical protein
MSRRIFTRKLLAEGETPTVDTYYDKLLKYIPADVVAAWILVSSLITSASGVSTTTLLWIAFGIGVVLTALWTWKLTSKPGKEVALTQILISTGAFIVWVFALGGPFVTLGFYKPLYGSLVMILYTLVVPLINPPEG